MMVKNIVSNMITNTFNKPIINVKCIDDYGNYIISDFIMSPFYKDIIVKNIITDDYGNLLYIHSYILYKIIDTFYGIEGNISQYDGLIVGSILPCINVRTLIHKKDLAKHKQSIKNFNEFERNCNTCANLNRVKHEKCSSGFLKGTCNGSKESDINYPLRIKNNIIEFHPHDHMSMKCYVPRN